MFYYCCFVHTLISPTGEQLEVPSELRALAHSGCAVTVIDYWWIEPLAFWVSEPASCFFSVWFSS
jgi:hypothetical protein